MYEYSATVTRWVDGDTVDLRVDLGFRLFAETRFRLYGIDTPERGHTNYTEATALANELAPPGATVTIRTYKDADKYGRWLADILTATEDNVNNALIASGYAKPYFGGTKTS